MMTNSTRRKILRNKLYTKLSHKDRFSVHPHTSQLSLVSQLDDLIMLSYAENSHSPIRGINIPFITYTNLPRFHVSRQVLRFFWLDAYCDNAATNSVVYLFGRVWVQSASAHVSCCVRVANVPRRVFLLPRKKVGGVGRLKVMVLVLRGLEVAVVLYVDDV